MDTSGGTATNDGSTWALATTLQDALANGNGKNCTEIWVMWGLYKPTTGIDSSISFTINRPLKLYGGFAGTEMALTDRSLAFMAANPTVLSGDIDNNDFPDIHGIDVDSTHISGFNSNTVVRINGTGTTTVIDGITITGGSSTGAGGGLYCNGYAGACSPTISNVVFSGNFATSAGGAMYNNGANGGSSNPVLTNVTFRGNDANYAGEIGSGGAMWNDGDASGNSSPVLTNVTFSGNSAFFGGAMYNQGTNGGTSSPTLTNVTFSGNFALNGGAIENVGNEAGIAGTSSPTLINVILLDDHADGTGPEIYNYGASTTIRYGIVYNTGTKSGACPTDGGGITCDTHTLFADPKLGGLSDNGGVTLTMLPSTASAAINTGDDGACPATDQRGVTRPQGPHCDIGAVEVVAWDRIFADNLDGTPTP